MWQLRAQLVPRMLRQLKVEGSIFKKQLSQRFPGAHAGWLSLFCSRCQRWAGEEQTNENGEMCTFRFSIHARPLQAVQVCQHQMAQTLAGAHMQFWSWAVSLRSGPRPTFWLCICSGLYHLFSISCRVPFNSTYSTEAFSRQEVVLHRAISSGRSRHVVPHGWFVSCVCNQPCDSVDGAMTFVDNGIYT